MLDLYVFKMQYINSIHGVNRFNQEMDQEVKVLSETYTLTITFKEHPAEKDIT